MTVFSKTLPVHSFREIWKLSVLVAMVSQSSFLYSQNNTIEVWKGGRRSEVQVQVFTGNGSNSSKNKAQAQNALIGAQREMQLGNFSKAIQLARFADSFPVSWGPTEISPRQVLMQLRAYQKQSSSGEKTRRRVKPFLWDSKKFSNRNGSTTQKTIPAQPVSNSSNSDNRFRSNRIAKSRIQKNQNLKNKVRFPPFPKGNTSEASTSQTNRTLPRSTVDWEKNSTEPWPLSEAAKANPDSRTTTGGNPFIVNNKIEDKKIEGPLLIKAPVNPTLENKIETTNPSEATSEKTEIDLFPIPPLPEKTKQIPTVAETPNTRTPSDEEPSSLLLNSSITVVSTVIGVFIGALVVIFMLKLFGKHLGPLIKVEVVNDGSAILQQPTTTNSAPALHTERSEEELEKHFEIPSLGSSYAEKRKADEEKRQEQEQEIFKLIMQQNIDLRDQLADRQDHAA